MNDLEDRLRSVLSASSAPLDLPPGSAAAAWTAGRRRHRRRQAAGAGAGALALGLSAVGVAALGGGGSDAQTSFASTAVPSVQPVPSGPTAVPGVGSLKDQAKTGDPRVANVSLPRPAPGFPVDRDRPGSAYAGGIYLVAKAQALQPKPSMSVPTDAEASLIVEPKDASTQYPYPVIGTTTVLGRPAQVVRSDTQQIGVIADIGQFHVQAYGSWSAPGADPVTVQELVILLESLTGLE